MDNLCSLLYFIISEVRNIERSSLLIQGLWPDFWRFMDLMCHTDTAFLFLSYLFYTFRLYWIKAMCNRVWARTGMVNRQDYGIYSILF